MGKGHDGLTVHLYSPPVVLTTATLARPSAPGGIIPLKIIVVHLTREFADTKGALG